MGYLERAEKMGLDTAALKRGETVDTTILVTSLEEYRDLFAPDIPDEQRSKFSKSLQSKSFLAEKRYYNADQMFKLMDYIYGTHSLTDDERSFSKHLFPVRVRVTAADNLEVTTDMSEGPAAAPWVVNAGTLTFNGGSLTAITTQFTLSADNLVVIRGGTNTYHVGIMGAKGTVGTTGATGSSYSSAAAQGDNGGEASPGICTSSHVGGTGGTGGAGGTGATGGTGANGIANLPATITIRAWDPSNISPFVVATMSGEGGQGGTGGTGGKGQNGGKGGKGCDSGCEGENGGNGGGGGAGGDGGAGGKGGNGTDGNDIFVYFPSQYATMYQPTSQSAAPGAGGTGGNGGEGGSGGAGGEGGKHHDNGVSGSPGRTGQPGISGDSGSSSGAPGTLNFVPVN
ncbi:hypothetical protein [Thalassospira marina]|uniref:Collagen-like protein n=1 Tax=Thalassospira marina TaxID=2048283 RepID=A0A2N3KSX3_9PROT|nr:hypothetical protein [Thalassospira marina]PKR53573.1 hypothetical protein COO20_13620 [Thalassospira marina]